MKKVWLGLVAIGLVYACSDSVGGMLEDAGIILQDAGQGMQDAGAQAQESKSVTCNRTMTFTANGSTSASSASFGKPRQTPCLPGLELDRRSTCPWRRRPTRRA